MLLLILLIISVSNRPEVSVVLQIFQVLRLSFLLCYRFLASVFIFTRSEITKECTVADEDYLLGKVKDVLDILIEKLKYLRSLFEHTLKSLLLTDLILLLLLELRQLALASILATSRQIFLRLESLY